MFFKEVLKGDVFGEVYGPERLGVCLLMGLGYCGFCFFHGVCPFVGLGFLNSGGGCFCHGFFHHGGPPDGGVKRVFLYSYPMQNPIRFLGKREKIGIF